MRSFLKSAIVGAGLSLTAALSNAALLGVAPGNPNTLFNNTGTTSYNSSTGQFSIQATPLSTLFPGGAARIPVTPPAAMSINMILDGSGQIVSGVAGDDLVVTGSVNGLSGVLLTGEIVQFGSANLSGTIDFYDFRFRVTGGAMAPQFAGKDVGISVTSENSTFTGSFINSFSGKVKGNLGPIDPIQQCTGAIGDFVWNDGDRDGVQDPGEAGIDGVTVRLRDSAGNVVQTKVTGAGPLGQAGYYQFTGLCAGSYSVEVDPATLPPGVQPSPSQASGNPATDSNGSPAAVVLATDNSVDATVDFGYQTPCSGRIGNFLWNDTNRNGIQEAGEPGLNGVRLTLLRGGVQVGTAITNGGGGAYEFTGLCAGSYEVRVDTTTLPAGFVASPTNQGADRAADSNPNPATPIVLAADNSSDQSIDFGYNTPCSGEIGDFIWNDANGNGVQDAGEAGISGISVTLRDSFGTLLQTASTSGAGAYKFAGLCAGSYSVTVDTATLPPGFTPSGTGLGGNAALDSNPNPASVTLATDATKDPTIDFGYTPPCQGSIGDFIFSDTNANGIQDAGEAGISGVIVNLRNPATNAVIATDTTGADGRYSFNGLCAGSYVVESEPPANSAPSPTGAGTPQTDSNPNPTTVNLPTNNSSDPTIDFGYTFCTGRIGNFVWNDANRNGIQDAGESGIPGVTVTLLNGTTNALIASKVTGANGEYEFTNLCAGSYRVDVTPPGGGFAPSPTGAGDAGTDSNPDPSNVTLVGTNGQDLTIDFGYNTPCSGTIGDFVWSDANRNGIQDAGEAGIPGVTVTLKQGASVVATRVTGANGEYQFTGLCAGAYTVEFTTPAGLTPSAAGQGGDPTKDSNAPATNVTLPNDNASDSTIDAGYIAPCTGRIGDFVWNDSNRNGLQDAGEAGIGSVSVTLSGTASASTTTAADGSYAFTGLCSGTYTVTFATPAGFVPSSANQGGDDAKDSDGLTPSVTLPNDNTDDPTIDSGFNRPCSGTIGDFVWNDTNRNGIQDAGEAGISGATVRLVNPATGATIDTKTTDGSGAYQFNGLCQGNYRVEVDTPAGSTPSPVNQGADDTKDSDGSGVVVNLPNDNSSNPTVDFGFNQPCAGRIGNFVWNDTDRDGIQDAGEAGIGNVTVTLSGAASATTTTAGDGSYQFTGLCAGNYTVTFSTPNGFVTSPANQGGDDAIDSDGLTPSVTLANDNANDQTIDSGFNQPCAGRIGNFVWNDTDRDGIQDAGEAGIGNVTVTLSGAASATTTTAGDGSYQFTGLCAGNYTVTFSTPNGFVASPSNQGGDDAIDSDGTTVNVVLLNDNASNQTIDSGFNQPRVCTGKIGNFVWNDTDRDGIQDAGEAGIGNVTVTLSGAASATTTTAGDGSYQFTGLCAGNYTVTFSTPNGFVASPSNQGGDDALDSDGTAVNVVLAADNSSDQTIDSGFNQPQVCTGKIGDFIWDDKNRNGIQEAGEPGLSGVTVILRDASAAGAAAGYPEITRTATDSAGKYSFGSLCAGTYKIDVVEPAGYSFSPSDQGGNDALDSDPDRIHVTLSTDSSTNLTIDFGLNKPQVCTGKIGDRVWKDLDGDGIQNGSDFGLSNVKVILLNSSGGVVSSQLTNSSGNYTFAGLCAGNYTVKVDPATLPYGTLIPTLKDQGSNDAVDSDGYPASANLSTDSTQRTDVDLGFKHYYENYKFRISGLGGKCLDVSSGYAVIKSTCSTNTWDTLNTGQIKHLPTGKCLALESDSSADGKRLMLATCSSSTTQKFSSVNLDGLIKTKYGKCVDVAGASTADGTKVQQWSCNGGTNQQWSIQ